MLGEGQTNIPDDLGIDQPREREKINLKNNKDGTKLQNLIIQIVQLLIGQSSVTKKMFAAQLIIIQ